MKINTISRYLILTTVFLVPFYFLRFKILGIPTNVFEVAVLVSAASIAFKRPYHSVGWWPWLLSGVALLTAIFSPDPRVALGIFKGWFLIPTLFAWAIVQVFNAHNINRLRLPLLASASIVSIWAILQKAGVVTALFYQAGDASFTAYLSEGRAFGPFESPNYLAMYLVPVFFMVLPLIWAKVKLWQKTLTIFAVALILLAVFFSLSRGGGAAMGVGLIVYLLISGLKKYRSYSIKYLAAAALTLIIALNISYYILAPRVQSKTGGDAIRQEILDYSLKLARQNPLWGVGLGNFQEAVRRSSTGHASFQTYALPFALHPHNLLLALWLNLGLAGLAVFLVIIYRIIKNLAGHPETATLAAALAAILVHGLFDTTYFKNDLSAVFWLIFAISCLLASQNTNLKSQNHISKT